MKSSITARVAAAVLFSLIVLLIYAAVQQTYRMAATDPQTGLVRDRANDIKYSRTYHFVENSDVNAQQSFSTFMQLYNKDGQLIYSGGTINGKAPHFSEGVLDNAKQFTAHAITKQPTSTMHLAAVATCTTMPDAAFVVVARSLQETENCGIRLITMIILFWAVGCGIIAMHWLVQRNIKTNNYDL